MSRSLRMELAGGLYHITSQGDRREDIYIDDTDHRKWLELLGQVCQRYNWKCHTYCLMTNHYHIVVETVESNLSQGMRQLNGVYTQYSTVLIARLVTSSRVAIKGSWSQISQIWTPIDWIAHLLLI